MNLKSGNSKEIINENIHMLMSNGYTKIEAIKMAYSKAIKKAPKQYI